MYWRKIASIVIGDNAQLCVFYSLLTFIPEYVIQLFLFICFYLFIIIFFFFYFKGNIGDTTHEKLTKWARDGLEKYVTGTDDL